MSVEALPAASTIVAALLAEQDASLGPAGAAAASDPARDLVLGPILALHRNNLQQWRREDDARSQDADDAGVAAAKRDIDRLNAARHRWIEVVDAAILGAVAPEPAAPPVTESPGMAIDRLSVLVIRLRSTEARVAATGADPAALVPRLVSVRRQLAGLEEAVEHLLRDLAAGRRRFVPYEGLKLYGAARPWPA